MGISGEDDSEAFIEVTIWAFNEELLYYAEIVAKTLQTEHQGGKGIRTTWDLHI